MDTDLKIMLKKNILGNLGTKIGWIYMENYCKFVMIFLKIVTLKVALLQ